MEESKLDQIRHQVSRALSSLPFLAKGKKDAVQEKEDEKEDEKEKVFDGDERDNEIGKQKLNGGGYRQPKTFSRKLMGAAIAIFTVCALTGHFLFSSSEDADAPQAAQVASNIPETKEPSKKGETKKENLSYKDLKALDQKKQAADKANAQTAAIQQAQKNPAATTYPAYPAAALPAAASTPNTPRAVSNPNFIDKAREAAEEMEKRYTSAIDFALGRESGGTANTAGNGETAGINAAQAAAGTSQGTLSKIEPTPYMLQAGTMIPAMLFSGINTDTPGQVTAQVTADIYDSVTSSNLLLPVGSRLIGEYGNDSAGNGRIDLKFTMLIMPDGAAYDIGSSMVAVDNQGYNGISGKVHRHTARTVSAGVFSSAIAALGSYASGDTSNQRSYTGGQLAMQGAMANLINQASNLFAKGMNVQPTVTIAPGTTFYIYVKQPIYFGH